MTTHHRLLPPPPDDGLDIAGIWSQVVPKLKPSRWPWIHQGGPYQTADDPSIVAWFLGFDRPVSDGPVWAIRGLLARDDGRLGIHWISVEALRHPTAGPPIPRVTGSVLRDLRLGTLELRAISYFATISEHAEALFGSETKRIAQARALGAALDNEPPPRGRPRVSDEELERFARAYLDLAEQGYQRGILTRLAEREHVSVRVARDRIERARRSGFLLPSHKGKALGAPGPRLAGTTNDDSGEDLSDV